MKYPFVPPGPMFPELRLFREEWWLLENYSWAVDGQLDSVRRNLIGEAQRAIRQADYLFSKCREAVEAHFELWRQVTISESGSPREGQVPTDLQTRLQVTQFEGQLFAETFYYVSFRIREILRSKKFPLPYIQGFESKGVRDVRNHVLAHPEKGPEPQLDGGTATATGEFNVWLRVPLTRAKGSALREAGLVENAEELKLALRKVVGRALSRAIADREASG